MVLDWLWKILIQESKNKSEKDTLGNKKVIEIDWRAIKKNKNNCS